MTTVHPHACGEYRMKAGAMHWNGGSSPRVWGIRQPWPRRRPSVRFIPTRVGNTRSTAGVKSLYPVHPHACGEYAHGRAYEQEHLGSSPRVWGILWNNTHNRIQTRFIPTRVGNTCSTSAEAWACAVHPHACGEYLARRLRIVPVSGSSPRVWGILGQLPKRHNGLRFIPTRVGNTFISRFIYYNRTVHPHACGEYAANTSTGYSRRGSSPRVWGIRFCLDVAASHVRFIPTRVGNTAIKTDIWVSISVHPHACGEYLFIAKLRECLCGSSPRVWGILPRRA